MSQQLRNLFNLHRLMDEATDGATGVGGGGDVDLTVNIEEASDAIGADLGLNEGEGTNELLESSATPAVKDKKESSPLDAGAQARAKAEAAVVAKTALDAAKKTLADKKVDITGKTDAQVLELAKGQAAALKAMPKSWKAENKAIWDKLPAEAQAYIEQRETQTEEGFKANGEAVKYGQTIKGLITPYDPLLQSQGAPSHEVVVKTLLNSHFILSTKTPEEKAAFVARTCKNYGVDPAAVVAAFGKPDAVMTETEKALKARLDALETNNTNSQNATFAALKADSAREVEAFASDPKNPYFNEVASEVSLFLAGDPKMTLGQAYERAVYANPVTRAKELARLGDEAAAKARTEAEAKAAAAEKARGTRIRGKEEERASPDLLGSMDETLRATAKLIRERQET